MENQIIISSNLFMNESATKTTMDKLSHIDKNASVVIINNAEPVYGITSVEGFKKHGFMDVIEITVSKEKINEQIPFIQKADIVVLSGGNPWMLLEALRTTDALLYVKDEAIVVGVSAGAMVLGKTIDFLKRIDPTLNENHQFILSGGYDLFQGKSIIPHADEEEYFKKEKINELINLYGNNFIFIDKKDEIHY